MCDEVAARSDNRVTEVLVLKHAGAFACVCMYDVCSYICMYVYIYVYMYVCIYMYICLFV